MNYIDVGLIQAFLKLLECSIVKKIEFLDRNEISDFTGVKRYVKGRPVSRPFIIKKAFIIHNYF